MKKHIKKFSIMALSLVFSGAVCAFTGCNHDEPEPGPGPDPNPSHTHSYSDVVTPPTCTERGYTTHKCDCGDFYVDSYVASTGHTEGEPVKENEVPSTCETEGFYEEVIYCASCKIEMSRNPVITEPHNFVDGVCTGCGATRDEASGLTAPGYTIDYSTEPATVSRNVSSSMQSVNLEYAFTVKRGYSWKLCSDADGKNEIENKQLSLSTGHNKAYIIVENENKETVSVFLLDIYRLNSYRFSFVNNGNVVLGGNADEQTRQYPPVSPSKEFYDFAGWTVDGAKVEFPYIINSDVTFTASFTPTPYKINYVLDGGSFAGNYPAEYNIESNFALVNPVKENYGFAGWYDNPRFEGEPVTSITSGNHGEVTYYAKWSAASFTITYELDGGEFKTEYVKNYTVETPTFELANPVKADYAFVGWFTDPGFTNGISKIEKGTSGNLTLYARWLFGTDGLILTLSEDGEHYIVSGYEGTAAAVEIPGDCYGVPVSEIGEGAFSGNADITEVSLPESIKVIGDSAFKGCSSLTADLPGNLTYIGKNAFEGCALTEVTLPEGLTFIGADAFKNCTELVTVYWNATDCKLENTIFGGCAKITEINIGENLIAIPDYAFGGCSSLPEFTIHGNIEKIGSYAFSGCSSLTGVTVPATVTEIGLGAFSGCTSLTSITVPFAGSTATGNVNSHFGYIFGAAANTNNSRFVPSSLKSVTVTGGSLLGINAFSGCANIEHIDLPETITAIGNNAFLGCTSLKEADIPDSVASIGNYAYQNCTALTEVSVPDGVNSLGMNAFYGCSALTSVKIGTGVTALQNHTFDSCTSLSSVTIPNGVTTIGTHVFNGCTSLKNITLPEELTSLGESAFSGCTALSGITIPDSVITLGMNVFNGCSALTDLIIGTGIKTITSSAFAGCSSLEEVIIPANVTNLGGLAFSNCSKLKNITLSENLTAIGSNAFYQCYSLNNVIIPYGVKTIGGNAFRDCRTFTEIEVPLSVTSIGAGAFNGCTNLAKLTVPFVGTADNSRNNNNFGYIFGTNNPANNPKFVPEALKTVIITGGETIANSAFSGCADIVNVTLPDTLITIGDEAFNGCSALSEIELTANITKIGNSAFNACANLTKIIWNAENTTSADSNATPIFADCSSLTELEIGGNVTAIPAYAFRSCNTLQTVTIGSNVKTIGEEAFYDCENVETLLLPEGLTSIGAKAFYNCNTLSEIVIHDEVTEIGANAFDGCLQMAGLTIGSAVETIGEYAFQNCAALTTVTVPDSVTMIGAAAFRGCIQLESLTIPFTGESVTSTASAKSLFGYIFGTTNYTDSYAAQQYYASNGYTNYYIPSSLTDLTVTGGNVLFGTFDKCSKLKNITLPENLPDVGAYAFRNCSALEEISLPATVITIGTYAFSGCTAMGKLTFEEPAVDEEPATLTINTYAFQNCSSLTDVKVPDRTNTIANFVFMGCSKLVSIDLPFIGNNRTQTAANNANVFGYIFGTTSYTGGTATSQTGTSAASYYIPATLRTVNIRGGNVLQGAFQNCRMLTSITLPKTLATQTALGAYAFQNCVGITSLDIPENTTAINSYAFQGCTSLLKAVIPAPVTIVNVNAYQNCTSLAEAEFAQNNALVTIGNYAFAGCSKLVSVDFGTTPVNETSGTENALTLGTFVFNGCTALNNTAEDEGFVIPARVTSVGVNAFQNCTSLAKLSFEDGSRMTSLGNLAFNACTKLESVDFGASETAFTIGSQAFDGCTLLARTDANGFTLPARVTSVGTYGFRNTGIANLSIEKNSKLTAIGDYAFYGLTKLVNLDFGTYDADETVPNLTLGVQSFVGCNNPAFTTLNIPARVTTIGTNAFQNCTGVVTINIADGSKLTSLGNYAFSGCTSLENMNFADTSTALVLGTYLFQNCTSLAEITVPDNVTTIGAFAFTGCSGLTKMTLPFIGNAKTANSAHNNYIFGYIFGTSSYTGSTVASQYGASAVNYYLPTGLTTVTITGGNILQGAFYGCKTLRSITLPNQTLNNTSIGQYAFRYCEGLEELKVIGVTSSAPFTLPINITAISNYAFQGCNNAGFTDIEFPASVTSIGQYAFCDCTNLAGGEVNGFEIPATITVINVNTFQNCTALKKVTIPGTVATIGNYAFTGCTLLNNVAIPASVTSIGTNAFQNCTSLSILTFDSGSKLATISNYAFAGCTLLNNVTIPASVATMGTYVFSGDTTLADISFEEPAEGATPVNLAIGAYMFENCTALVNVTLPDRTNTIANFVFKGCSNLASMDLPFVGNARTATGANAIFGYIFGTTSYTNSTATNQWSTTNYYIPNDLTAVTIRGGNILQNAFLRCKYIQTLILPERLYNNTVIGDSSLRECTSLTTLKIIGDTSSSPLSLPVNTTTIGQYVFYNSTGIAGINIPETVTSISHYSFQGCTALTGVKFAGESKLASLGNYAFTGCTLLNNVAIPASVTSIGTNAFQNCTALSSLTFDSGSKLATISNYAFAGCTLLNNVAIPASVAAMGTYVFSGDTTLADISFEEPAEGATPVNLTIGAYTFENCTALVNVTLPDRTNTIANFVFKGCINLTSLNLPFIGANRTQTSANNANVFGYIFGTTAYEGGTATSQTGASAATYYIPATLTTVVIRGGNVLQGAFQNCASLTSITLPDTLNTQKAIGNNAFLGCTGITEITLPSDATSIGASAFSGCINLESITIPETLTTIGANAFAGCDALTDVYCKGVEENFSITLGTGNEKFDEAVKHYEEPAPEPEPEPGEGEGEVTE